jgi:hypothetical protein
MTATRSLQRLCAFVATMILLAATGAAAFMHSFDNVPSATLLVPYFEVDTDPDAPSVTTELTVSNQATIAICLAHFTLWTDLGLPTINFNALIDPGGTIEIDLHELFTEGELPFDAFGSDCDSLSTSMPATVEDLVAAHTGRASGGLFGGMCGAIQYPDRIARGFITVDSVDTCTELTPRDATYFTAVASEANVLTGSYTIRTANPTAAAAAPMVHIEADSGAIGLESFYYRFPAIPSTADGREPLPSRWAVSFYNDLSDVVCWRDQLIEAPVACPVALLAILPRDVAVYRHDGEELPSSVFSGPCRIAAGRVTAGSNAFPIDAKTGSVVVDVDADGAILSGVFTPRRQAVVSVVHRLHPGGLTVHVPGSAVGDSFPVLLSEGRP